ncbi:MAG: hypothetical protein J0H83_15020 [Candidatus Melainabacteria bacterium]|nr:hypothetical protein [Candidatus Melainabacteria bacterium]MBX9673584.1 hypothetical protein [Candidatus Obscuribacterales bacterium]
MLSKGGNNFLDADLSHSTREGEHAAIRHVIALVGDRDRPRDNGDHGGQLSFVAERAFVGQGQRLAQFERDMRALGQRAGHDGLSQDQVANVYKQVGRLLEGHGYSDGGLSRPARLRLAEQVMHQAAVPTDINQGQHNSCQLASLESRMYTRDPERAAQIVADVALNGRYKDTRDRSLGINARPHDESIDFNSVDDIDAIRGKRSHASEIFQVTAANIMADIINERTHPRGQVRFEQQPDREVLIDYAQHLPKVLRFGPGALYPQRDALPLAYNAITGRNEKQIMIAGFEAGPRTDMIRVVTSERDLANALLAAKQQKKFPLLVSVQTDIEPFWTDSNAPFAGGTGGGHVVTVRDYRPGPVPIVTVDNQWGRDADHDMQKPLRLSTLYAAINLPDAAQAFLERKVELARLSGRPDVLKEIELFDLKARRKSDIIGDIQQVSMPQSIDDKEVARLIRSVVAMPKGFQRDLSLTRMHNAIGRMPESIALRLLPIEHSLGLLDREAYKSALQKHVERMGRIKNRTETLDPADPHAQETLRKYWYCVRMLNKNIRELGPGVMAPFDGSLDRERSRKAEVQKKWHWTLQKDLGN